MTTRVQPTKWTRGGAEPRLMISKYRGKCSECGGRLNRGRVIAWSRARGARHPECAGIEVPAGWLEQNTAAALAAGLAAVVPTPAVAPILTAPAVAAEIPLGPRVPALLRLPEPPEVDDRWWDLIADEDPALVGAEL